MYTVKIDDGFCEWEYEFDGSSEYSICDIADVIVNNTKLSVVSKRLLRAFLEADPESSLNKDD
jgi:hypothetical protein